MAGALVFKRDALSAGRAQRLGERGRANQERIMSDLEHRKPRRLTFHDLITAAQSADPSQRKQAFGAYQAWKKAAPRIPAADRLSHMQCDVLNKVFAQKGFNVGPTRAR